ncbi:hypothetical protein AB0I28_27330 [Phytomonospora sp. NPDC050363]
MEAYGVSVHAVRRAAGKVMKGPRFSPPGAADVLGLTPVYRPRA